LLSLLLTVAGSSLPLHSAEALGPPIPPFPGQLVVRDETITARIDGVPLRQVLEEVARQSGARVYWVKQSEDRAVSAAFTALPVPEALRRLLGEGNFLLFYTSAAQGARLTQMWISPGRLSEQQPLPLSSSASGVKPPALPEKSSGEGRKVSASTSLWGLLRTARYDEDPSARLDAITYVASRALEDPQVINTLSLIADDDTNPQVRDAAAEVLRRLE